MLEKFKICSTPTLSVKTIPLIKLLCQFNGGCAPETLNCEIRKNYNENLKFIQSLTTMTKEDVAKLKNGQQEFTEKNILPGKKCLVTNHLKHHYFEVYPSNFTNMGSDRTFALRGYLSITIRFNLLVHDL